MWKDTDKLSEGQGRTIRFPQTIYLSVCTFKCEGNSLKGKRTHSCENREESKVVKSNCSFIRIFLKLLQNIIYNVFFIKRINIFFNF